MKNILQICTLSLLFLGLQGTGIAQDSLYTHFCPLTDIETEWYRIALPEAVFRHGKSDLSDVRIIGKNAEGETIKVPYIIEWPAEKHHTVSRPFKTINASKNSAGYYYTFALANDEPISSIKLHLENENFDWKVTLEGSNNQEEWFEPDYGENNYRIFSFNNGQVTYRYTDLDFTPSEYKYYRIAIKSDEKPINLHAELALIEEQGIDSFISYSITDFESSEDKKNKKSLITFTPQHHYPLTFIQPIVTNDFDYYRPIRITTIDSFDTKKGKKPLYKQLAHGIFSSFESGKFRVDNKQVKPIQIQVANHDNPPLDITKIQIEHPIIYVKARFSEKGNYSIYFGNPKAKKPEYDIKYFKEKIPNTLPTLTVGTVQSTHTKQAAQPAVLFENKLWMWLVLVGIIGLLGWFSLKMLQEK